MERPVIAVTMGDPAGIGPEVTVKAAVNPEIGKIARVIVIGEAKIMRYAVKIAKPPGIKINPVKDLADAKYERNVIDVLDLKNVDINRLKMGVTSPLCGKASVEYVLKAIDLALAKKIDALVTGPINKEAMNKAGFKYRGHTEILARRTKTREYGMLFVAEPFWLLLVTTHLAIKDVPKKISKKNVLSKIKMAHEILSKFLGKKPRIGVAGLNPHAGEGGLFGDEEKKYIRPAVADAQKQGIDCKGPISPDAIFNMGQARMFDIIIAMYHDQGLIPLKLLSFNKSVNVTLGLPIIRTSVDHGTGFNIAGKGWANPGSMIEAIKVATHFARSR